MVEHNGKATLFLKASCPFCLKAFAFLYELGELKDMSVETFYPGDEKEAPIREYLGQYADKISFPSLLLENGKLISDSEEIVEHYTELAGIREDDLTLYSYIMEGPYRRMRELFAENRKLISEIEALS